VTGITIIGGAGVVRRLTLGDNVVMTTGTRTEDFIMIQWRDERCPARWRYPVAGFAIVGGIEMVAGFTLSN